MHPTQKGILVKLMQSKKRLSFGELLPESMKFESDKFNYHLKHLVKEELVKKISKKYRLSRKGLQAVSILTAKGKKTATFKVSVALVVLRTANNKQEILLQKRLRHPFYNDTNSISGKVEKGEKIIDAAKRKLYEETGLKGEFRFVGTFRKCKLAKSGEILEDTFYNSYVTENPTGKLVKLNEHGENFWINTKKLRSTLKTSHDIGKEDLTVFERILNGDYSQFFIEQKRVIKSYTK